jgi:hypothetical protein
MRLRILFLFCAALAAASPGYGQAGGTLEVRADGEWRVWWNGNHPAARWVAALPLVERAVEWHQAAAGLDWGELDLSAPGQGWRTKAVVVRVDPRRYRFNLEASGDAAGNAGKWTVADAAPDAALAVNAGQFEDGSAWGWVVHGGHEARPPRAGVLSSAIVFEASGNVTLVDGNSIAQVRGAGFAFEAFQSYPTLLTGDGDVPEQVLTGAGLDIVHREGRLAIGELRDGRLLFVLTRFDALGGVAASAPLGLTIPEMSAVMGALGCRRAVSLDGGLSSQLLVRERGGNEHVWKGWRKVPMGLIATPRPQ